MAKSTLSFVCQNCGAAYNRWQGKCESCGEWNTLSEEDTTGATSMPVSIRSKRKGRTFKLESLTGKTQDAPRLSSGMMELDRVTGGGFVRGSVLLVGGDPGIGKSTLLTQATSLMARAGHRVVYISGEEAVAQVRLRAERLGLADAPVQLAAETSVEDIVSTLSEGPVPRLIVVRIASGAAPDLVQLRQTLTEQIQGASLDDHRGFVERMRAMAGAVLAGGIGLLLLVFAATVLSVAFATLAAMATNRPVIEVLHLIGAKDSFIAGHFQRHFLLLGLEGGLIGGGSAIALFALAELTSDRLAGTAGGDQFTALFGSSSIGALGYLAVLAQVGLIAFVTAATSRFTVNRTIETIY